MPKRARIKVSNSLLSDAFGFDWKYIIVHAQVDNSIFSEPTLELIVESDTLPEEFYVQPGMKVKEGVLVLHKYHTETEITAIP